MSIATVGWIGIGIMGRPMAGHLMRAGYALVVLDRPSAGIAELVAAGARTEATPRDVAAASDAVVTMLPGSAEVEDVVLGPNGVRNGLAAGALFIDMSSIAPAVSRRIATELAAIGVDALDAPVSGGETGAVTGELAIMAGGSERAFSRARVLLERLGTRIVHIGESGAGQIAKVCNQVAVAITIEAVAEALALAEAAGVDAGKVREALMGGLAASRILERYGARMLASDYVPGARATLHLKDLDIATQVAADAAVDLPGMQLVRERYAELVARDGDLDHSALRTLIETARKKHPA
jgi:2-hydroxy-3-oxopropionate reductase